ncbi:MAG TPA: hypothetical protein VFR02_08295, partial [bacterium]|nr:hypothetical protein [bacterium]
MSAYTNIQYLLKNGYLNNEIIQQFAEDTVLYQVFEKDNKWVKAGAGQGQGAPLTYGMAWPIETQRNNSVGTFGVSSPNLLPGSTRSGVNAYTNLLASHAS